MKEQRRLGIIIPTLMKGGAEKQSILLANLLCENHKVYFIILKGNYIEPSLLNLLLSKKIVLIKLKKNLICDYIRIYKVFKQNKIDTVFSYLASGNFINGVIGRVAQVPNRIGGIRNARLSKLKLPLERFFHNKLLTMTISNSYSAVMELSEKGFKKNKFQVIHNAFHLKQVPIRRQSDNNINILSVARFVPQKDYFTAIDSIKFVKNALEGTKFTFRYYIVGYGVEEKEIRNRIARLNLNRYVEVVISPKNIFDYFKKADLFLTTSLYEGMSNSVMEALSYSLPIVATNAGDMEYLVKNGFNGFLCPYKQPRLISKKIVELITNFDLRSKMGTNSYLTLKHGFNMQEFSDNYTAFLNFIYSQR